MHRGSGSDGGDTPGTRGWRRPFGSETYRPFARRLSAEDGQVVGLSKYSPFWFILIEVLPEATHVMMSLRSLPGLYNCSVFVASPIGHRLMFGDSQESAAVPLPQQEVRSVMNQADSSKAPTMLNSNHPHKVRLLFDTGTGGLLLHSSSVCRNPACVK